MGCVVALVQVLAPAAICSRVFMCLEEAGSTSLASQLVVKIIASRGHPWWPHSGRAMLHIHVSIMGYGILQNMDTESEGGGY